MEERRLLREFPFSQVFEQNSDGSFCGAFVFKLAEFKWAFEYRLALALRLAE